MKADIRKIKNLFLRQSYLDSWADYERSLNKNNFIVWDYIIITASNDEQAANYRAQIDYRIENNLLPKRTNYAVLPDPDGKRVGSGGATFNVLKYIRTEDSDSENPFVNKRILVIHSGGDSKRIPQYSATGKLFSPVPRELPNGQGSTLFDEFIIGMSGVPSRMRDGMLVLSGDVLLLFNPLQIDTQFNGAAAISIKESVVTGKDHGVFLNDGNEYVKSFLHKQTEEYLRQVGAVNNQDCVDLDTGAIFFDTNLLDSLLGLISTDNKIDDNKFDMFVNEDARVSFYGDFLYPLASSSTLEDYYNEKPEGSFTPELKKCRTLLWDAISKYSLKLLCLSPAEFIHFGTTWELLQLVTKDVEAYEFLDWKKQVISTSLSNNYAAHKSYIGKNVNVGKNCYLEHVFMLGESVVGDGAILSNLYLRDINIPSGVVMHGLQLKDNKYIVRIYGINDNPKSSFISGNTFLDNNISNILDVSDNDTFEDLKSSALWDAPLFSVCDDRDDAINAALVLWKIANACASEEEINSWKNSYRLSLNDSFNQADSIAMNKWHHELENRILSSRFLSALEAGAYYKDALKLLGRNGISVDVFNNLMSDADRSNELLKMRIYYSLSRYMKENKISFNGHSYDTYEAKSFKIIEELVLKNIKKLIPDNSSYKIVKDEVNVELPVRVNWGGGWTDTPPYCFENGGLVLNAAIKLNGLFPVRVCIRKTDEYNVQFASEDIGAFGTVTDIKDIRNCRDPFDPFALHKAALVACGIIPMNGKKSLDEILKQIGGGIYLSTQVIGIPKGSGLGTSSILSGACVKAILEFFGIEMEQQEVFTVVSCMEQIMSTGGGWQDQVGGLTSGIKLISTKPGVRQQIKFEPVLISEECKEELRERFALIYSGQRRLARNLLHDVVGNYITAKPQSVKALKDMKSVTMLMKYQLENGNVDEFAELLNQHWELSKQLDEGSTNTCIDQIFLSCEDLISGKFIAGAGGGGFMQVILKKGVTKEMLSERLRGVFQDSKVDVWDCEIVW